MKPQHPPERLEIHYQARGRDLFSLSPVPTFIAYGAVYVMVFGLFALVTPRFEQVYGDFNMELPAFSRFWFAFGRWFRNDFGWFWLLPVPAVAPLILSILPRKTLPDPRVRRWRIAGLTSMILLLMGIAAGVSLFLPYVKLIDAVSAP